MVTGDPNRVGPASLFIVIMMIFLIVNGNSKKIAMWALPNMYVFLMGGSRTYFVLGMCTILLLVYVCIDNNKVFFLLLIPMILIGTVLVLNSNMMQKFAATFQEGLSKEEFWRRLTNTRSVFWVEQLHTFASRPFYNQLLGNGINFTTFRIGIWAHNDFIEILCSYGYIGLINYIALIFYSIKTLLNFTRKMWFVNLLVIFIWLFNAFFNFYYCYFCSMLSFPILLLCFHNYDSMNGKLEESIKYD